jgi:pimeloyl-ACP methyl ester carboxylesterase
MKSKNHEHQNQLKRVSKKTVLLLALVFTSSIGMSQNKKTNSLSNLTIANKTSYSITYKTIQVDGLDIFYRETGDKNKPAIVLLHGFPSSSHMYRDLIIDLSSKYHVIAPDYPGFGQSSSPSSKEYEYTFDHLSITVAHFIDKMGLKKYSLYMQDYGGPIGFRIANRSPEAIQSLIIQNANAYSEGLGVAVQPLVSYFKKQNLETEKGARAILTTTKWQYTDGVEDISRISPDSYVSDQYYLDRKGNDDIQLALFRSYGSNVALYDKWHSYFRKYQPQVLVVWGKNDQIFISAGADAYKKDLNNIEVHLLNGGHFLLEEHHKEVATLIDGFLSKRISK